MAKSTRPKDPSDDEPGFDARLARLEALVAELEEGELGLEPAIERYQEGVELLQRCRDAFTKVKGFKPPASRSISREMYVIAEGYRGADAPSG